MQMLMCVLNQLPLLTFALNLCDLICPQVQCFNLVVINRCHNQGLRTPGTLHYGDLMLVMLADHKLSHVIKGTAGFCAGKCRNSFHPPMLFAATVLEVS